MQIDDMILVSVDDHVVEPPGMWDDRVPKKYADEVPKLVTKEDGNDVWSFRGAELPNIGLNAVAGRPPAEYGIDPTSFADMRPGCYDIKERVRDMNANGVLGSLCFPSMPGFCGQLWSRVLQKFPDLKFAMSEGGIGWIPYFLERVDYVYKHHTAWTGQDLGGKLPSELFNERIITCFIDDAVGLENRHHLNLDHITWECDYPHSDSTWPHSPELLAPALAGIPDAEINKITHENAIKLFSYNPFTHIPKEACTVVALRAQATDVDTSEKSDTGAQPRDPSEPPITILSIVEMAAGGKK